MTTIEEIYSLLGIFSWKKRYEYQVTELIQQKIVQRE